jgi:hypothetical protein
MLALDRRIRLLTAQTRLAAAAALHRLAHTQAGLADAVSQCYLMPQPLVVVLQLRAAMLELLVLETAAAEAEGVPQLAQPMVALDISAAVVAVVVQRLAQELSRLATAAQVAMAMFSSSRCKENQ